MALGNDEIMVVALAVLGVVMSSTWSTMALGMFEPILREIEDKSSEIPLSIFSIILTQLNALQKRQTDTTSLADKNEIHSDSADPSDSVREEEGDDSSSEEEEQEVSSSSDHASGCSSDCVSEVTSHRAGPTGSIKRKRSRSSSDDAEVSLLRENTKKVLDMYREYTVAQKLHDEAQLELHQNTLTAFKEVGMANAEAIDRVADAILKLAATAGKRPDGLD